MAEIIEIVEINGGDEIIEVGDIILTAGYDVTDAVLVNVTNYVPLGTGYYTLTTAIAAVPNDMRKTGLKITFAISSGVWVSYQFKGASIADWSTEANWELQGVSKKYVDDGLLLKENTANKKTSINDSDTEFPTSKAVMTALNDRVSTSNIANNLTTTAEGSVLDARQGPVITTALDTKAAHGYTGTAKTLKEVDDAKVSKTGDETIAGVKTFSSSPIIPTPTTDMQASTKKYVDDVDAWTNVLLSASLPRDYTANKRTNKRYHSQGSPLFTQIDNTEVADDIFNNCNPCIIDRNADIVSYLDKDDVTKLLSGSAADLTKWDNPVVLQYAGFYTKYEHDLATNEKILKFSMLPIKGYTYHKRRFRGLYDGTVVTNSADGTSKSFLTSNSGVYSTHSVSLQNFHAYAKNLGPSFRAMSWQDHEILTWLFWLIEGTTNSQAVYRGIVDVNGTNWAAYNKSADGGQSTYGQFYLNGITNDIVGHKGEKTITIADFPNGAITVKPHKWMYVENFIAGPYWLAATGRLFSNDNVYEFKDLSKIAFTVNADASLLCSIAGIKPAANGYQRILETYRDTLVPEVIGGSNTTGYCDQWYGLSNMGVGPYVPMLRGAANDGSNAGLGFLFSNNGPAAANAAIGAVLAADDPSDPIPDGYIVS